MDMDNIYLISDVPGYTPQIGRLLSMTGASAEQQREYIKVGKFFDHNSYRN